MQITYIDILKEIGDILNDTFPKLDIKITPWQVYAGEGYDKLSNRPQILINLGTILYTAREYADTEAGQFKAGIYEVSANVQISVGKTNLNDKDDFEIEDICDKIIDLLHFKSTDAGIIEFISQSNGVIDSNMNYWRHLRFTINRQLNIGVH